MRHGFASRSRRPCVTGLSAIGAAGELPSPEDSPTATAHHRPRRGDHRPITKARTTIGSSPRQRSAADHGIAFSTRGFYLYVDVVPQKRQCRFRRRPDCRRALQQRAPHQGRHRRVVAKTQDRDRGRRLRRRQHPWPDQPLRQAVVALRRAPRHRQRAQVDDFQPNIEFSTPLSTTTYAGANIGAEFVGNKYADYYYTISPTGFACDRRPCRCSTPTAE